MLFGCSGVGTMGTGGVHCAHPQVQDLYPLYPPSQRCGLCQNFNQTTLTTRLYKVRTNLYTPTYENLPTRLFGCACSRVGPRNPVLSGGQDPPGEILGVVFPWPQNGLTRRGGDKCGGRCGFSSKFSDHSTHDAGHTDHTTHHAG